MEADGGLGLSVGQAASLQDNAEDLHVYKRLIIVKCRDYMRSKDVEEVHSSIGGLSRICRHTYN